MIPGRGQILTTQVANLGIRAIFRRFLQLPTLYLQVLDQLIRKVDVMPSAPASTARRVNFSLETP